MSGLTTLVIIFLLIFFANRGFQLLIAKKREVVIKRFELESACSKRAEHITAFLKKIKNELKGKEPSYEQTLSALKATLEAKPPKEQGAREQRLCDAFDELVSAVRKYDALSNNVELRNLNKLIAASDAEIAYKAEEYNHKVEDYNRSFHRGLASIMAKIFKLEVAEKFPYERKMKEDDE
ncbi:MAG: hypothetical protein Kow0090_14870 [Myxococcota bacterium]